MCIERNGKSARALLIEIKRTSVIEFPKFFKVFRVFARVYCQGEIGFRGVDGIFSLATNVVCVIFLYLVFSIRYMYNMGVFSDGSWRQ